MDKPRIRAVICERSALHHDGLKQGFGEALGAAGYRAEIHTCASIDDALKLLSEQEFELLITDLSFGRAIAVGLDFIKLTKTKHPSLFVIACSSVSPLVQQVNAHSPSFDMFLPKNMILNPGVGELESVGKKIEEQLGRLVGIDVRIEKIDGKQPKVSGDYISDREIHSLISQVLSDLNTTDTIFQPVEATFTPVTGGYSGSLVGTLTLRGRQPLKYVKSVVKISHWEWAKDEASNFKRYAKWMLPFNKRVELVGEGRTCKFGAVAYAFVYGGEDDFTSLSAHIEAADEATVTKYINKVFDSDLINFYNSTRIESDLRVGQHYRARYFPDDRMDETRDAFQDTITRLFGGRVEISTVHVLGQAYTNPFNIILLGSATKFSLSICHGDLNANNIICAAPDRVAYIDFQDTGPGHLHQDFAALESSVRMGWRAGPPKGDAPAKLLARERSIAELNARAGTTSYDRLAVHLRALAAEKFPQAEAWEYPYAVAALSLKLLRLKNLTDIQRCRLAACALVATKQVEDCK